MTRRDEQVARALAEGVGTRARQMERAHAGEEVHELLGDMIAEAEAAVPRIDGPLGPVRPILSSLWDVVDEPGEEDPLVPALLRAALAEAKVRAVNDQEVRMQDQEHQGAGGPGQDVDVDVTVEGGGGLTDAPGNTNAFPGAEAGDPDAGTPADPSEANAEELESGAGGGTGEPTPAEPEGDDEATEPGDEASDGEDPAE